ncbi:MAG: BglG family transcription antiterminator [Coprobacillaceae bacterium]
MINGRMLRILHFLYEKKISSYKIVAMELEIKERLVRYDIERINDILMLRNLPIIERLPKGELRYPEALSISDVQDHAEFIYTQNEREDLIVMLLLLNSKELKLNKLSKQWQVSRSTLKNDLSILEEKLQDYNLSLQYRQSFYLEGSSHDKVNLMINEFEKYIQILKNNAANAYEEAVLTIITNAFETISTNHIINWVDSLLDSMQCVLTDHSYCWYVSNILILVWFIINKEKHPLELSEINSVELSIFDEPIKELETIIKQEISLKEAKLLIRLLNYTNKHGRYEQNVNLILVESIVQKLIHAMSTKVELSFENNLILFQGLMNHITALVTRVEQGIVLDGDVTSILGTKDLIVFEMVHSVMHEIEILKVIKDDNEIAYIAIHFIASIKRIQDSEYKHILLVCGFGYGTSVMLKETLMNEFQVKIEDIIPTYRIQNYESWDTIDYVISTSKIQLPNHKQLIVVNPILSQEDYLQLTSLGIARKKVLANYYSINKHLDFLTDEQRLRVLDVIRKELEHQTKTAPSKISKLTDLLSNEDVLVINQKITWEESAHRSANPLLQKKYITDYYVENIINSLETLGFYAVTDESFALLHGESNRGVNASGMSLLINQEPVYFGEKKINIIFTLATKDRKEHIPAVITWVRMINNTDVVQRLSNCKDKDTAYQIILQCERRVLQG